MGIQNCCAVDLVQGKVEEGRNNNNRWKVKGMPSIDFEIAGSCLLHSFGPGRSGETEMLVKFHSENNETNGWNPKNSIHSCILLNI